MLVLSLEQFTFDLPFCPCTSHSFKFDLRIANLSWNLRSKLLLSGCSSGVVDWGLTCYLIIFVHVAKKGSSAQHPARFCNEIRDFGDSIGDGEH